MVARGRAPIPLSREIDCEALCRENPCDALHILGSFWPHSRSSVDSRVVKAFKECSPASDFRPYIADLCEFYAQCLLNALEGERIDWLARVLGSSECEYDPARPQSLLLDTLAKHTGAREAGSIFYKSGPRPPMRTVSHLSGPEALRTRIRYASQDLFVRPSDLGGTVLLLDDIMNTGASMRVYADALKRYAGAQRVVCVNLAVTRFDRGKDGRGMLVLDTSILESKPGMTMVWLDEAGVFHSRKDCTAAGKAALELRFLAERKATACDLCCDSPKTTRKWWQIWRGKPGWE